MASSILLCCLLLPLGALGTGLSANCMTEALPSHMLEWQDNLAESAITVEWGFGKETCSSVNECYGLKLSKDINLDPQIMPIQVQQGLTVKFKTSEQLGQPLAILPYRVSKAGYDECDTSQGTPIIAQMTSDEILVKQEFLQAGDNYFIAQSSSNIFKCEFGLRLNITVKTEKCSGVGELSKCWNHGRCATTIHESEYNCHCCYGHTGTFCENIDACVGDPCHQNATCIDLDNDPSGTKYRCHCPTGYYGNDCQHKATNLCETSPCINGAVCEGNATHYVCHCPIGYDGEHCEVNPNDCAASPCVNGLCVDRVGGYQCYCKPGYQGFNCEREYDECRSNPCKNGGFCIDEEDGYTCHCTTGYTGEHCDLKVDLCNPSRCENATECIDYGHSFSCTCNPGFMGTHCEVNINECISNPCQHGGKCYDETAGYRCICAHGFTGTHCEYLVQPPPRHDTYYTSSFHHRSHLTNLGIVAGTLAGALLIALTVLAGCYCKVNQSYKTIANKKRGYTKHEDESGQQRVSSIEQHQRPSIEAIMEATTPGYHDNSLNAPLVTSLKPKRV